MHEEQIVERRVRLLRESLERLVAIGEEQGWDEEQALGIALHHGLAELVARSEAPPDAPEDFRARWVHCEQMYAVMKFKVFSLQQDNQTLQFRLTGSEGSEQMWKAWAEDAKAKISRLAEENDELRQKLGLPVSTPRIEPAQDNRVEYEDPTAALKRSWHRDERR